MATESQQALRELVAERAAAVRAKDPGPLAARQAPDIVLFNVVPPLRMHGKDGVVAQTQAWFDAYESAIGYEVTELHAEAAGDLGFCSFLYHVSGTMTGGTKVDMWVRATLCCRRVNGAWLITHDHESVPFDGATGRAVLDLTP